MSILLPPRRFMFSAALRRRRAAPLLDVVPGALAAYSFRQMRSSVASVARVRRGSDNAEQDFSETQLIDGTLPSFLGSSDGFVRTWYDQSGNGYHQEQPTAAAQPVIAVAGVLNTDGGRPYMSHAGTRWMSSSWGQLTGSVPQTMVGVFGKEPAAAADYLSWGTPTVAGAAGLIVFSSVFRSVVGTDIASTVTAATRKSLVFNSFDGTANTNNTKLWVDAVSYGAPVTGITQSTTSTNLFIGRRSNGTSQASGISSEYVVYPSDLTDLRTVIERNIDAYYCVC